MDPLQNDQTQPVVQPQSQPMAAQPVQPVAPAPAAQPLANPAPTQPQPVAQQQMPKLDDQFLQTIGLGVLPDVERQGMLQQMQKTLETNVGMEIYKNLQEYQLQEFEGFMPLNDENGQVITSPETANANAQRWLDANVPTYKTNPAFQPFLSDPAKVRDLAAMNWLQRNFPAYRDVVAAELNKLMTEVRENVPRIIEAVMGPQNLQVGQTPAQPQVQAQPPTQGSAPTPPSSPSSPTSTAVEPVQQPPVAPVS